MSSSSTLRAKQDPRQKKRSPAVILNLGVATTDMKSSLNRAAIWSHRLCSFDSRLSHAFSPSICMQRLPASNGCDSNGTETTPDCCLDQVEGYRKAAALAAFLRAADATIAALTTR